MMRSKLLVIAFLFTATAYGQGTGAYNYSTRAPDCSFSVAFTSATRSGGPITAGVQGFDNRALGCVTWSLMYMSTGFSSVSIELDTAADSNGQPGSWNICPNVGLSAEPLTNTSQGQGTCFAFFPWISINVNSVVGQGLIQARVIGWRAGPGQDAASTVAAAGGGGGSGTIVASPQFQLPFYSAAGTATTLTGDSKITTDGAGNLTVNSFTVAGAGAGVIDLAASAFGLSSPNFVRIGAFTGSIFGASENTGSIQPATLGLGLVNSSVTGTTINTLTKITTANCAANTECGLIAATTDTGGIVGVTVAGAGTTGTVQIRTAGQVKCAFDAAAAPTAGDYVQISATVAGDCLDAGATYPTAGQVIGRVLTTGAISTTQTIDLFPSEVIVPATFGNITAGIYTTTSSSTAFKGSAFTNPMTIQQGVDANANSAGGQFTLRTANETGAGGAASRTANMLIAPGSNAATNVGSKAGSLEVYGALSTGATQGQQGLFTQAITQIKGATATQWLLECPSGATMTVVDCGASPGNWLGVAQTVGTNTVIVVTQGETFVTASAAVTLGHTVCVGATATKVTDSGGTTPCALGSQFGIVIDVSNTYFLGDGTTTTASTTLPLVLIARD